MVWSLFVWSKFKSPRNDQAGLGYERAVGASQLLRTLGEQPHDRADEGEADELQGAGTVVVNDPIDDDGERDFK